MSYHSVIGSSEYSDLYANHNPNELEPVMYNDYCYNQKEDDMEFKGYDLAKIVNQENGFTVMLGARHYVFNSWNDMVEFLNAEFNPFEEEE